MPHVVNGIGTWYYGKGNLETYQGVCGQCQQPGPLKCYDTRLYVVFIMIPVFPLQRKRILDDCSHCRRHLALPLDEYQQIKTRNQLILQEYAKDPRDGDKAAEALTAIVGIRDVAAYRDLARQVETHLKDDARSLLMISAAHSVFGHADERERLIREAIAVSDDEMAREALADALMGRGETREVWDLIRHVVDKGMPDKVSFVFRLAQLHQKKGEHTQALDYFRRTESLDPRLAETEVFRRLRAASESRVGSTETVDPVSVVNSMNREATWASVRRWVPIVSLVLVAAWAGVAHMKGQRHEVHVLNALSRHYTARIGHQTMKLAPGVPVAIRLPDGKYRVDCPDLPAPWATSSFEIRTSFWGRPMGTPTYVLNPDCTAVLEWTKIFYSSSKRTAPDPVQRVTSGQLLSAFDDLDHPFEALPQSVTVSSGGSASRTRLRHVSWSDVEGNADTLSFLARAVGKKELGPVLGRLVTIEPNRSPLYGLLSAVVPAEETARVVEPLLAARPVNMDAHRTFQAAMQQQGRDEELRKYYAKALASTPTDPAVRYLEARVSANPAHWAKTLKELSAQPCPDAVFWSLGQYALGSGEFSDAVAPLERFAASSPNDLHAKVGLVEAYLAAGRGDDAIRLQKAMTEKAQGEGEVLSSSQLMQDVNLLSDLGRTAEARERVVSWMSAVASQVNPVQLAPFRAALDSVILYAEGKPGEAAALMARSDHPRIKLISALMDGKIDGIADQVAKDDGLTLPLVGYLLLRTGPQGSGAPGSGDSASAATLLEAAAKQLEKGGAGGRVLAGALRGSTDRPASEVVQHYIDLGAKPLVLAALGVRHPTDQETYFALARKLDFRRSFPHLLLEKVLRTSGQTTR